MKFGSSLAAVTMDPEEIEERAAIQADGDRSADTDRFVVSWDEYLVESFPPAPSLWGDALMVKGGGYLIVGGDTGVGKTILISNLILSLADAREQFLGFALPGRPVRCLFLEAEGSRHLFRDRLRQIAESLGVTAAGLPVFFHRADAPLSIEDPAFRKMVEQAEAEVAFLDPIGRFHASNENDAREWRLKITAPLAEISRQLGVAFVFCDHFTKPNETRRGPNQIRGSAAKLQDCGAAMRLEIGKAGGASRVLYFDRVRDAALPFPEKDPCRMPLEINLKAGTIAMDEREGADDVGSTREGRIKDVVDLVGELGAEATTANLLAGIKQRLALEQSRAEDLIAAAFANRAIERARRGLYRLPGSLIPEEA